MLGFGVKRVSSIGTRWLSSIGLSGTRDIVGANRSSRYDEREKSSKCKSLRGNHTRCSKRLAVNPA